jgi:hypothetical protein
MLLQFSSNQVRVRAVRVAGEADPIEDAEVLVTVADPVGLPAPGVWPVAAEPVSGVPGDYVADLPVELASTRYREWIISAIVSARGQTLYLESRELVVTAGRDVVLG